MFPLKTQYEPFSADVWATGVLLVFMLTKALPFKVTDQSKPNALVKKAEVFSLLLKRSPQVQGIISEILLEDSSSRLSSKQVLDHTWFKSTI